MRRARLRVRTRGPGAERPAEPAASCNIVDQVADSRARADAAAAASPLGRAMGKG
jgi:hypothetical protein